MACKKRVRNIKKNDKRFSVEHSRRTEYRKTGGKLKLLIAERDGFCYYYDGENFEKQERYYQNNNSVIKKLPLTTEEVLWLGELDYQGIYNSKRAVQGRPERSHEMNLYSCGDMFGSIRLNYHFRGVKGER